MMKRSAITVLTFLMGSFCLFSQEEENSPVYIPEKDDWSIGIDATPFLNYFGNFIGGAEQNEAPTWTFLTGNQQITGKYFVEDDMAYRGSIRIGLAGFSITTLVNDRSQDMGDITFPDIPLQVENKMKISNNNIGLSGGVEWRKGKNRLQGFYGGELGVAMTSLSVNYEYGNELTVATADNPVNVSAADEFSGAGNLQNDPYHLVPARIVEQSAGLTLGVGLRGFVGAEYFILPKLSLGGEFGWGLVYMSNGAGETVSEMRNPAGDQVGKVTRTGTRASGFSVDTDSNNTVFGPAAALRISLYF